ncbi:cytochrome P450 [Nocardia uniformis]|uniref:Cytochrome P450 n=1 Tax=Nocardia uniformis TaxID=53432 RepID=A0A849BVE7_9NOCA|nr:cytochrome P450 [Nocardia uniformis]NNH70174.1 cytochrome P450 [Nocardia uniformis]
MTISPTNSGVQLPHPPKRLPLLGDVLTTDFAKPAQSVLRSARTLGPVFQHSVFGFSTIIVAGAAEIDEVNDESRWRKFVGPPLMKLRPIAGDGVFTAFDDEPNWRKAHNVLVPAFTKSAMSNYHSTILDTVRELVEAWSDLGPTWVDLPEYMNRLALEVMARAGFSHSFSSMSDPNPGPFIGAMLRELRFAMRRTDVLPWFERTFLAGRLRRHHADLAYVNQVADEIIVARRAAPSARPRDVLDLMLTSVDPQSGDTLDMTNIRYQILTFLIAGSETSANAISFALHYLSRSQELAEQVRAEISEHWPGRDFPDIRYDEVAKLRGLRRVVDETLRLWPTAPGYFRQARCDTALSEGRYSVRTDDWVLVFLLAAHRDQVWGPDADVFNPHRFAPDKLRSLGPRVYKPFGTGPRACLGRQFALHEIMVTLAVILHQFDLEPDPDYQLDVVETVSVKPVGLRLRFRRR